MGAARKFAGVRENGNVEPWYKVVKTQEVALDHIVEHVMNVEIFYFKDCPNHQPTVDLVQDVVAELGLTADIVTTEVTSPADARRLRFLGSPSVRVDGIDVEPAARSGRDFGLSCRTYDGHGMPDRKMITDALRETQAAETSGEPGAGQRAGMFAVGGAVASALASSACCWIPLTLIAFGVSAGGVAGWLAEYRLLFVSAAALFLATGFYFVYFRKTVCASGCECAALRPGLRRFSRVMIWVATGVVFASVTFPNTIGYLLGGTAAAETVVPAGEVITVTLPVDGMTCEACAVVLRTSLVKVPGVLNATVSYPDRQAVISIDSAVLSGDEQLVEAIRSAGYDVAGAADRRQE